MDFNKMNGVFDGKRARALVLAPFFSREMNANRSVSVASVLSDLAEVEVVTTDFDHWTKKQPRVSQNAPFDKIVYIKTLRYKSNIGIKRLLSHLLFSIRAARYFLQNREKYDIVYVTLPLNILAWFVLRNARTQFKIVDVIDIWPDVLPFPKLLVQLFRPLFVLWRRLFNLAVGKADVMLAVSDSFYRDAARFVNVHCRHRRFYIGDVKLQGTAPKEDIKTIAYIGNIGHLYDFETLLDAMENVQRGAVQLFIVGAGGRQEWLLKELKQRGLPHQYFGVVYDQAKLGNILLRAHVGFNGYLNTSAAFSYKANTYFAAGLPILNSMSGDLHDLVELHSLGLNYPGGDSTALQAIIDSLTKSNLSQMSENCSRFFDAELDRGAIRREIREFVRESMKKSVL